MGKILDRVRKMLALSASSPEKAESETAAKAARRLMMEHAISMEDVLASERPPDPIIEMECWIVKTTLSEVQRGEDWKILGEDFVAHRERKTGNWKRRLGSAVADYLEIRFSFRNDGINIFTFYGFKSDVETAVELYQIIADQIVDACTVHLRQCAEREPFWDRGMGRGEAARFRETAIDALEVRLDALKAEQAEEFAHGNALLVTRSAKVNEWVNERFTFSHASLESRVGYSQAGWEAGNDIKLSKSSAGMGGKEAKGIEAKE